MRNLGVAALAWVALIPATVARADDQATVSSAFSAVLPGSTATLVADPQGGREVVVTAPTHPADVVTNTDISWRATLALGHAMETIPDLVSMSGPEPGAYVRLRLSPSDPVTVPDRTVTQADELARVNHSLDALRAAFPEIEEAAAATVPLDTTPDTKAFAVGVRIRVPDLAALRGHFPELTHVDVGDFDSAVEVVDDAGHTVAVWLAGGSTMLWVDPAVGSTACDLSNHHPFGACPGEVDSTVRPGGWLRPRRADGFAPTRLTPSTRRVRIEVRSKQCATLLRVKVRRHRDRIVLTAMYRYFLGYGYDGAGCPYALTQATTVGLHGRLGHRVLIDGATTQQRYV